MVAGVNSVDDDDDVEVVSEDCWIVSVTRKRLRLDRGRLTALVRRFDDVDGGDGDNDAEAEKEADDAGACADTLLRLAGLSGVSLSSLTRGV